MFLQEKQMESQGMMILLQSERETRLLAQHVNRTPTVFAFTWQTLALVSICQEPSVFGL